MAESSRPTKLVIATTSRALFDLAEEDRLFSEQGVDRYREYQRGHESDVLGPGPAYPLIRALLGINNLANEELIEVVLVSKNDFDTGLRVLKSIDALQLGITRSAFTSGVNGHKYLGCFDCGLFLSVDAEDVRSALQLGVASALVYVQSVECGACVEQVRIAFDGDAVLFSPDAEDIFRRQGMEAFRAQERKLADVPLGPGPFKGFAESLGTIQRKFGPDRTPIRTALITARNSPAHIRAINTLRAWDIRIDECFFLGGLPKSRVLRAFQPHIFFDDQACYLQDAPAQTCVAQVLTTTPKGATN